MKATGAQIKDFWDNGWPSDNWYYEPEGIRIADERGNFLLEPDKEYALFTLGDLEWQGKWDTMTLSSWSFEDAFKRYQESLEYEICTVKVPKHKTLEFLYLLKVAGYETI